MSNATIQTGVVHSYEDCPRCKGKGSLILETHVTGEQAGNCGSCGYQFTRKVLRNNKGEALLDHNNNFTYTREEIREPYGAIHIIPKEGDAQMYSVPTEKDFKESIMPYIQENENDIERAVLSQYVDNQIIQTELLTNKSNDHGPETTE